MSNCCMFGGVGVAGGGKATTLATGLTITMDDSALHGQWMKNTHSAKNGPTSGERHDLLGNSCLDR
jgi:hypothetical protein